MRRNKPKIIYRRLGEKPPRHVKCTCEAGKATDFGEWSGKYNFNPSNGVIKIDPRQPEKELLDTIVHELLHDAMPFLEENAVETYGSHIAKCLWEQGWRRTIKE